MRFWRTLRAMLREIFEETAFERYCERERLHPDREAYARFVRESRPREPRCC